MVFFSSTTAHPIFVFAHGATNVACGVFPLLWLVLALPYCASWSFIGGSFFFALIDFITNICTSNIPFTIFSSNFPFFLALYIFVHMFEIMF